MTKIGIVQLRIVENDWEGNFRRVERHLQQLARQGAQCVILPEMWTSSTRDRKSELAAWSHDKLHWFQRWALAAHCYVIFSQLEGYKNEFYNTAYTIAPTGDIVSRYRKVHLFAFGGETDLFHPGHRAPPLLQTPWGPWAVLICFDLRFPILFRRLARQGVTCFVVPAQWPENRGDHWLALLKARAIENQCMMIGVNRLGTKEKEHFHGASVIFDPWGNCVTRLRRSTQCALASVNMAMVDKVRSDFPCLSLDHPQLDR